MFGKSKPESTQFPKAEFIDRLSSLLSAAVAAKISKDYLADQLEGHADALRKQAAIAFSHNTVPVTYDGHGNLRT